MDDDLRKIIDALVAVLEDSAEVMKIGSDIHFGSIAKNLRVVANSLDRVQNVTISRELHGS